MTPAKPTAASTSATPANAPSRIALSRRGAADRASSLFEGEDPRGGLLRVDLLDRSADRLDQARGIHLGPDRYRCRRVAGLRCGDENLRTSGHIPADLLDVLHFPYDGPPRFSRPAQLNLVSDRVGAAQKLTGEGHVHDRGAWSVETVRRREVASCDHGDPKRLEIVRGDRAQRRVPAPVGHPRVIVDSDGAAAPKASEWQSIRDRNRPDTWQRPQAFEQHFIEPAPAVALEKRAVGEPPHAHSHDVVRSEAGIDGQQLEETARQQAPAHTPTERRPQLGDHKALADPGAVHGSTRLSATALQPFDQLRLRSGHGRGDTERNSR